MLKNLYLRGASHRRIIASIALAALTCSAHAEDAAPLVTVATPVTANIAEWDEYTGRFVAKQRVEVRARVSGYLDSVHFHEGQSVTAGQLMFVIDPRPFEAEVERTRAELERVETTLKVANLEFERSERLESSRAMSREKMEERRAIRDAARAGVAAARAQLRAAELDLSFTEVRAPMSGRASDIRIDVGNLISGGTSDSTVLTTIIMLDPIELEFEGSESEFLRYTRLDTAGTRQSSRDSPNPVEARLIDEQDWVHKGVMTFVDNEIDLLTGTMRGRATLPNPDHVLLPGMFARLRLFASGEHPAILIPDAAIMADQATKLVLVVNSDDIVEPAPVILGPLVYGLRVVRSGLTGSERIVVNGLLRAQPGRKVTPQDSVIEMKAE